MACQLMKVLLLTMHGRLGKIFFHPWLDNLLTKLNHTDNRNFKSFVKLSRKTVNVDPQLIFQSLITVGVRCDDLQSLFKYKLCSHPIGLFESSTLLLQANKAALADVLLKENGLVPSSEVPEDLPYL